MDNGEVALDFRVEYNAPPLFGYAEGYYLVPSTCMREAYYRRKNESLPLLQSSPRVADLQRGLAAQAQAPSCWNQLVVLIVFSLTLASCIPNAQIVNESASGGTALYTY